MTEPAKQQGPPLQQFNVYSMIDTETKDKWVGGSYDAPSSVSLAGAIYQARQVAYATETSPNPEFLVGVFDQNDKVIAFIGVVEGV